MTVLGCALSLTGSVLSVLRRTFMTLGFGQLAVRPQLLAMRLYEPGHSAYLKFNDIVDCL
jgi:hypothetical protein